MKSLIKLLLIIVLFVITFAFNYNKAKILNIEDAINNNYVSANITGLGGYRGYCILLQVSNLLNVDTTIYIEAGRRLNSIDSTVQDILITKEVKLFVKAGEQKNINLFGFCCQATNHAPSQNEKFDVGHLADSNLVKLAKFLNSNNYDNDIIQNAVWVISNNHPIYSVGSSNSTIRKKINNLYNTLASIKHLPIEYTWYSLTYKTDTAILFTGIPDSLYGDFDYQLWNNSNVSITMNDSTGHVVKRFMANKPHNPDKYNYEVRTSVFGFPKGKYTINLFANNQLKIVKKIEL